MKHKKDSLYKELEMFKERCKSQEEELEASNNKFERMTKFNNAPKTDAMRQELENDIRK